MSGGARPVGKALAAALGAAVGLGRAAVTAAELTALAAQPLPLAIRDGRVAQLTVHAVPFELGSKDLLPGVAQDVAALAARVATDCFLTAQAIGHVRPGTPGDGETLAAHRLARARAEAVQAALVRDGLPAASVATVWDYQFSIREPRVTLWVFSLPPGEECTGAPLPTAPKRVAAADPPAAPAAASAAPEPERSLEPAPGIHLARPQAAPTASPVVAAATPAAVPIPAEPPAPDQVVMAVDEAAREPAATASANAAPTAAVVPATPAEPVATAEIVFEPNSSYFPRGAEAELRRLVEALPPGPGYTFELAAAVDDTVYRVGDPAKAVAYNEWLAERRQGRVADWLEQHVEVRTVEVDRVFVPHDASRRVVIRARALP